MKLFMMKLLGLFLLCLPCLTQGVQKPTLNQHLIILDASDAATRLYLYQYSGQSNSTLPQIKLVKKVEVTPGLSDPSIVNQPTDSPTMLTPYFTKLFQNIDGLLTAEQKNNTDMYLFATSGIRNLPLYQQQTLLNNVSNTLVQVMLGLNYNLPGNIKDHVKVVSGAEEGLYNWITINYLTNNLSQQSLTANNTYPSLRLDDESAQVTFLAAKAPTQYAINFTLAGNTYPIYSYSYDNGGTNNLLQSILTNNPLSAGSDIASCFPVNSHYPLTLPQPMISEGKGNFNTCLAFLQNYAYAKIKLHSCEYNYKTCSLLGVYQPVIAQPLVYVTSSFYNTLSILGDGNQSITLQQIKVLGKNYCQTSWQDLKQKYPNLSDNDLITTCFNAVWISTLLQGFNLNDTQKVMAINTIGNTDVSWTLGSAIYQITQK